MMSLPVWLPGPMFLLGVSVPGPMFLLGGGGHCPGEGGLCPGEGGLCPGGSLSRGSLPGGCSVGTLRGQESGQYASYWNDFLLLGGFVVLTEIQLNIFVLLQKENKLFIVGYS